MDIDYSRFTHKSRNAIEKAASLSKQCHYAEIVPQVLMVAVFQEGNEMVPFLLNQMGADKIAFFTDVSDTMQAIRRTHEEDPVFSSESKNVLKASIRLAENDHCSVVPLEYIFWAFAKVPNIVNNVMARHGINSQRLEQAIHVFQQRGEQHETNSSQEEAIPTLYKYGTDLIRMAEEGTIEPVIGRDEEIRRILQIISRKTKNNPVLIGEPGTGKTAIVEGLAHRLVRGDVPQELQNIKLFSLNIPSLIAGTQMQGEFEKRLKKVIEEAESDPNIVLFIDELHLIIGAGQSCGAMDAANMLKPELARGRIKIIGATTLDEYRKHIEKDKAFERRFQKIMVDEPDVDSSISIMRGIKGRFENHHHIKILDNAIVSAVNLSHRYIPDRFLPDKAIDLLDEAASSMRINQTSIPHDLEMIKRQIKNKEIEKESLLQDGISEQSDAIRTLKEEIANLHEKENVINAKWQNERHLLDKIQRLYSELDRIELNRESAEGQGRYSEAVELQRQGDTLKQQIENLVVEVNGNETALLKTALDEKDIMKVVTAWTGIPMSNMTQDESERLLHIEESLHHSVIGQEKAIKAVSNAIRRSRMGLNDANKPIGTFLFLGTTGVGKTELCKALAEYLFGSRDMMVRIDMSEYQQEHTVSRLFGAPPGYVGYGEGGQLSEAVRRKPYSVVLLDEIEKAHPKVFETLLQVLDDGRLTDGQGHLVNFKNTIIIMTSNIGQEVILNNLTGQDNNQQLIEMTTEQVIISLKKQVAPEFINRIDDIIMFLPLSMNDIIEITRNQLSALKEKLLTNKLDVHFDDSVESLIAQKAYSPEYGARPVKRAIKENIVDSICMALLRQEVSKQLPIVVTVENECIAIQNGRN